METTTSQLVFDAVDVKERHVCGHLWCLRLSWSTSKAVLDSGKYNNKLVIRLLQPFVLQHIDVDLLLCS
jgi:hypothetical protein